MKAIHWTNKAKSRLRHIEKTIAEDDPKAAKRMVARIIDKADQAGELALSGKVVPEYVRDDLREVKEHPYRIIYRIKEDQIDVITVKHVRQQLPRQIGKL